MAKRYGLDPARGEPETVMNHIASTDGLGVFVLRLQDGRDLAKKRGERLAWKHFMSAYAITEKSSARGK
jgi:hypothetical protein